ncbi:MAG: trypsin-like serine protease [Pseudohongiella sp.]
MTNSCLMNSIKKIRSKKVPGAPEICFVLLCLAFAPVNAIVIRHDTGYTRYLASEADYPGVFPLAQQGRRKVCVATVVAPQWALTAAHCASETGLQATLTEGRPYAVQIARQTHYIDALHLHPGWTGELSEHLHPRQVDLALLRLSAPVSADVVLELYRGEDELRQAMTFLGWGYTGIGTTGMSVDDGQLRFAQNTVVRADERLRFEFNDPRVNNSEVEEFEGIPALGDSGGPALLTQNETMWLAGIAVGELTGEAGSPGPGRYGAVVVYERVSQHLAWIDAVIKDAHKGEGVVSLSAN